MDVSNRSPSVQRQRKVRDARPLIHGLSALNRRRLDLTSLGLLRSARQDLAEQAAAAARHSQRIAERAGLRPRDPGEPGRLSRHQELVELIGRNECQRQRNDLAEPAARLDTHDQEVNADLIELDRGDVQNLARRDARRASRAAGDALTYFGSSNSISSQLAG